MMRRICLTILAASTVLLSASLGAQGAPPTTGAADESAATPNAETPDAADQRIRCRRIDMPGSIIRRERVCKTLAEWRRLSERGNDVARAIVESGRTCAGGQCTGS